VHILILDPDQLGALEFERVYYLPLPPLGILPLIRAEPNSYSAQAGWQDSAHDLLRGAARSRRLRLCGASGVPTNVEFIPLETAPLLTRTALYLMRTATCSDPVA